MNNVNLFNFIIFGIYDINNYICTMRIKWDFYYKKLLQYKHYTEIDVRYISYYIKQFPFIFHKFVIDGNYKIDIIFNKKNYEYYITEIQK